MANGTRKIHVLGASGAGTTTLGRALAEQYGVAFFDADDYFWQPTDPPFQQARERSVRLQLLSDALAKANRWVLSGSICGWGDPAIPLFDLVVFVVTATDVRLQRLRERESRRFGQRISPGGDMYSTHAEFLEWAAEYDTGPIDMRSLRRHEDWLQQVVCPVLRVDGSKAVKDLCKQVSAVLVR